MSHTTIGSTNTVELQCCLMKSSKNKYPHGPGQQFTSYMPTMFVVVAMLLFLTWKPDTDVSIKPQTQRVADFVILSLFVSREKQSDDTLRETIIKGLGDEQWFSTSLYIQCNRDPNKDHLHQHSSASSHSNNIGFWSPVLDDKGISECQCYCWEHIRRSSFSEAVK